jgi:hypothetical protein
MQHRTPQCHTIAALMQRCVLAVHVRLPLHVVCRSHAAHCRAWLCFDTVRVLLLLSLCAAGKALVLRFDISLGIRQCCADRQPRFAAAHVRLTHSHTRSLAHRMGSALLSLQPSLFVARRAASCRLLCSCCGDRR